MPSSLPSGSVANERKIGACAPMGRTQTKVSERTSKIVYVVLAALILGGLLSSGATAPTSPSLSKKELKVLLASAKTADDHERLAAYYRDKAQRLVAKSQEFSAQAESLAGQPAILESKQGISCPCALHYRYFSKQYAQDARDAEAIAEQHEKLATAAQTNVK